MASYRQHTSGFNLLSGTKTKMERGLKTELKLEQKQLIAEDLKLNFELELERELQV